MERFLKFCADLDELGYFKYADNVFTKYAYTQNELLKKQILIYPNDILISLILIMNFINNQK